MKIFILFKAVFVFSFLMSCGTDSDVPLDQASVSAPPQNPSASTEEKADEPSDLDTQQANSASAPDVAANPAPEATPASASPNMPAEVPGTSEKVVVSSDVVSEKPSPSSKGVARYVCSKGDKKVVYVVYKPGVMETRHNHVCEVDDTSTAVLDWAAHNEEAWCDKKLSELVKAREAEDYVCAEDTSGPSSS